ncbi:MAG: hypothetical protein AAF192_16610, partial [Pseudomonadota bacterium]
MTLVAAARLLSGRTFRAFQADAATEAWASAASAAAAETLSGVGADRCGGTWDVGLDALPNGPDGAVEG